MNRSPVVHIYFNKKSLEGIILTVKLCISVSNRDGYNYKGSRARGVEHLGLLYSYDYFVGSGRVDGPSNYSSYAFIILNAERLRGQFWCVFARILSDVVDLFTSFSFSICFTCCEQLDSSRRDSLMTIPIRWFHFSGVLTGASSALMHVFTKAKIVPLYKLFVSATSRLCFAVCGWKWEWWWYGHVQWMWKDEGCILEMISKWERLEVRPMWQVFSFSLMANKTEDTCIGDKTDRDLTVHI